MHFEIVCDSTDREKWLEARRSGIGASDTPAVLGISPFSSPLAVYTDKLGLREEREATEAMKWGNLLEPLVVQEFAAETGRECERAGQLLRSTAHPWALATLDAVQKAIGKSGPGVLEVKTTGRASDWTEGIPAHVMAQAQKQLLVTGYEWGSVAVLMFGSRLLWADFERDEKFIAHIIEVESEFWRRVEAREPVAADGSDASAEALRLLYPRDTGEVVNLPGELIALDAERVAMKAEITTMEKRLAEIDAEIKAAIGDASVGVLMNGVSYSYRVQSRKGYVVEPKEMRVLRRSEPKGK